MSTEPVRFAIVGLGMGMPRARMCQQTEGARLVAVCDINEQRGRKAEAELGVPWVSDYGKLLERDDIDVVFLLTPSGMHAEMGIQAARAGKHVVCTKPIDVTLEAIDALISACQQAGVLLAVDFQERYAPFTQRVRRAVQEGLLGNLILLEARLKWYRSQEYYEGWHGTWKLDGGGSLMNQSIHLIDLVQWLGGPVRSVFGRMGVYTHQIETEDLGLGLIDFENGAKGVIVGTTTYPESRYFEIEVHGSKGAAAWGSINGEYSKFLDESASLPEPPADAPKNIFEDVVRALRTGQNVLCDGSEGRKSVELILAIYKSAMENRPVELPLKDFTPPAGKNASS